MNINLTQSQNRREFFRKTTKLGMACGLVCLSAKSRLWGDGMETEAIPDPKKLNYCGYTCPAECPMKNAGLSDDIEVKRKAYDMWDLKGRYGLEFDPDQILCNGCKTDKKELGAAVSHCTVRQCAIDKKVDCCIECDKLTACDKALWKKFPDFHKGIIEMQKKFRAAG